MKIALGCDHAGLPLMEHVRTWLTDAGHELVDFGTHTLESVDYTDFAHKVAQTVAAGDADRGVVICGTGLGTSYTVNRYKGIRGALCTDTYLAKMARMHNNANVLAMGARVIGAGVAEDIVQAFFNTEFEGGRHERRVNKIDEDCV